MGYDSDIYDEAGTTLIEPAGEFSFLRGDNLLPLDIDAMELLYGGNDDVRLELITLYIFDPEFMILQMFGKHNIVQAFWMMVE